MTRFAEARSVSPGSSPIANDLSLSLKLPCARQFQWAWPWASVKAHLSAKSFAAARLGGRIWSARRCQRSRSTLTCPMFVIAAYTLSRRLPSGRLRERHEITDLFRPSAAGVDGVVPVAVEGMALEIDLGHLWVRGGGSLRIGALVNLRPDPESGGRSGRSNEADDGGEAHQRFGTPVHRNVREQAVLDLVPLAGSRREVANGDGEPRALGELAKLPLPQADAGAVAPTAVRCDEQRGGTTVRRPPHQFPPAPDRVDREARRVVIDPDADPAFIAMKVVDAVGNRLALLWDDEVVHPHGLRCSFRPPLPAHVLEVADQLLLFRVHRNGRLRPFLVATHLFIDVPKLRVAIGMLRSFAGLSVRLQAVAAGLQKLGDQAVACGVPPCLKLRRQATHALRRPTQWRLRITRRRRLYQRLQVHHQRRVLIARLLASTSRPARPVRAEGRAGLRLLNATYDRRPRDSGRPLHQGDPAMPQRPRLRRRPESS